jgi:hypothetical protein
MPSFITNSDGSHETSPEKLLDRTFSYYSTQYTFRPAAPSSYSLLSSLFQPVPADLHKHPSDVTDPQIAQLLKHIPSHSEPGLDGIPYECWKAIPDVTCSLLRRCIAHVSSGEDVPDSLRKGLTIQIPKKNCDPSFLHNRRPITLQNSFLKLTSHILKLCLNNVAEYICGDTQFDYLPKRSMHMGIMEADVRTRQPGFACFVDI